MDRQLKVRHLLDHLPSLQQFKRNTISMQLSTLIAGLMAAAPLVAADCFNIVCASEPYLYVPNYATCPTNLVPVVPAKG